MNVHTPRTQEGLDSQLESLIQKRLLCITPHLQIALKQIVGSLVGMTRSAIEKACKQETGSQKNDRIPTTEINLHISNSIEEHIKRMQEAHAAYLHFMEDIKPGGRIVDNFEEFTREGIVFEFMKLMKYQLRPGDTIDIAVRERSRRSSFKEPLQEKRPAMIKRITPKCRLRIEFTDTKGGKRNMIKPTEAKISRD